MTKAGNPEDSREFAPVILGEDDTQFVQAAVEISGFRYRTTDLQFPDIQEGAKLEIRDEVTSSFVISCLTRRAELCAGLVVAHRRAYEKVSEGLIPAFSPEAQDRVKESVEVNEAIAVTAQLVIDEIVAAQTSEPH